MPAWLTRAAVLATLIITPLPGAEVAAQSSSPARSLPAHAVAERPVEHRQDLGLDGLQVTRLTQLAHRLRGRRRELVRQLAQRLRSQRTEGDPRCK